MIQASNPSISSSIEATINGGPIKIESSKMAPDAGWRKNPELRTMGSQLQTLSNRDLIAFMARISRPLQMREHPLECSQSYLNPNIVPNTHILDTEVQIRSK